MTKAELLKKMAKLGACPPATAYVSNHTSDDAQVIWQECSQINWLLWYASQVWPAGVVAWAHKCADRAKRHGSEHPARSYAKNANEAATNDREWVWAYASCAADYACIAAPSFESERDIQLKSLHAWRVR